MTTALALPDSNSQERRASPGPLMLLRPKLQIVRNFVAGQDWKSLLLFLAIAVVSVLAVYTVGLKLLTRIDSVTIIGPLLKRHLLGMILFSLLMMLVFSNVITSLSTFYASEELDVIFASPTDYRKIFLAKFLETTFVSSWMVFAMLLTLLAAYGQTYQSPWYFYVVGWLPLVPYCLFASSVGVTISLVLARILPVHQTRNVLRFLGAIAGGLLVLMIRMLRPEQLMRPEKFKSFTNFLFSLHNPKLELFPSAWTATSLLELMGLDLADAGWETAKLFGGALLAVGATGYLAYRIHFKGWLKFQESGERGRKGGLRSLVLLEWLLSRLSVESRSILEKDIRIFMRSPVLWTQFLLMMVIVAIYIYNVYLLPLQDLAHIHPIFPDLLSFLNIGFVSFIVVACALRFGYPAVSMEGTVFYRIHASPIRMSQYLWIKFWTNFVPLLLIALLLVVVSNSLLGVRPIIFALSVADAVLVTLSVSAMAILFGSYYRNFKAENFAQIPSGFGGMVFMVACLAFVVLFLALQAFPMFVYYENFHFEKSIQLSFLTLSPPVAKGLAVACLGLSLGLSLFLWLFPMRLSAEILRLLEEGRG